MSPPISGHVAELVQSLFASRSVSDRLHRHDRRPAILAEIAAAGEIRVVPNVLPFLAIDGSIAAHVARTVADLVRGATPAQLSWLDEQVRHSSHPYYWDLAWHNLAPESVAHLAHVANADSTVVGLLASHANGFVRAAALEVLAQTAGGQEIPFLSLRANDWVEPVASRASELLINRLRPDNRDAILNTLPFIVGVLGRRRRRHGGIERALTSALLADGGEDALARRTAFDTSVRRTMFELLTSGGTAFRRRFIDAALSDPDAVIRSRAIRYLATDVDFDDRPAVLDRLMRDDPVPAIRRLVLNVLSERMPERIAGVFPHVLLDRAASVRALARFVARTHDLPLVPRDVYVRALASTLPAQIAPAIEGVGETGTGADADLVQPFLGSARPRIRRSALRSLARLDAERAVTAAIDALADEASSVQSAAVDVLADNANSVDFAILHGRVRSLADPRARRELLRLFMHAPRWEAAILLLETLTDPDATVRSSASGLVDWWVQNFNRSQTPPTSTQLQRIRTLLDVVAPRISNETASMLRFCIKSQQR